ncbi:MAG: hypothetical protein GEV03_10935 [Streptosporangiales bacterium]|nr:hypothetical protein [Streptosporangiales bacterium]
MPDPVDYSVRATSFFRRGSQMLGIRQHTGLQFWRHASLRTSLILLVLLPSVALAGLGGWAANALLNDSLEERAEARLMRSVGVPAYEVLASLQEERRLTAVWLAAPTSSDPALYAGRRQTDAAVEEYRRQTDAALEGAGSQVSGRARAVRGELEDLSRQRAAVDSQFVSPATAFRYYTKTITLIGRLQQALSRTSDGQLANGTAAVAASVRVGEMIAREDALLSAAWVADELSSAGRRDFAEYVAGQRLVDTEQADGNLPARHSRDYERITASPQWEQMASIEDAVVVGRGSTLPAQADQWRDAVDRTSTDLRELSMASFDAVIDESTSRANDLLLRTSAGGVVGLLVLILSGVFLARASHALRHRLSTLRETIHEADARLPELAARLERGEEVDLAGETKERDWGVDELGQLGANVVALRRTAETAVVRQAQAGEGTTKILANLARRTQILVHREISMLDAMERTYEDPELLEKLFAVDHTATRVRRHAENLLLLAGTHVSHGPNEATPLVDVLRSAVSEIEDYGRVTMGTQLPRVSLAGPAGTDVIHLVAELLENGAFFSPPHTKVGLSAEETPNGLVIEVEDRGLGMKREEYEQHNERLANPPAPELVLRGKDARLGLFVVARLAQRHGIEVSLRRSRYGGTSAVVLLPKSTLKKPQAAGGIPGLPAGARVVASASGAEPAPRPAEDYGPVGDPGGSADTAPEAPSESDPLPSTFPPILRMRLGSDVHRSDLRSMDGGGEEITPAEEDVTRDPSHPEPVTDRGFPKRVRGASLTSQLHELATPSEPSAGAVSLEQVTAALAAMQRGSSQARAAAPAGDEHSLAGTRDQDLGETTPNTKDDGDGDEDPGR